MKLAIVGSVSLAGNAEAARLIRKALDRYVPTEVVSGGAEGVDTMAAHAARERGIPVREFLPAVPRWTDGYRPRNLQIAEYCDALIRIVVADSRTYGSGWTRDQARRLGKPTEEFVVPRAAL